MDSVLLEAQKPNIRIKATDLTIWLLSRGISSITTGDISVLLAIPKNQVSQRLAPLKKRGEITLLANGLWAPVPPEYLTWGAPPAIDIIDALMHHLSIDSYYVGWLSAAVFHGAAHHAPQVFQVAVTRAIRFKKIGRSIIHFYYRDHTKDVRTVFVESKNGAVPISNKETTLLDITSDVGYVGGIDNAANLVIELCEASPPDITVINDLSVYYPVSAIRRLGYIFQHFTDVKNFDKLKAVSDNRTVAVSLLDPKSKSIGCIDKYWKLKINREVCPDL